MKTIVTIGPASKDLKTLKKLQKLKVDCFRINLSHCDEKQISEYFDLFNTANIVPALDTQGAQARLLCKKNNLFFDENENLIIFFDRKDYEKNSSAKDVLCSVKTLFNDIKVGENIRCDFGELLLKTDSLDNNLLRVKCKVKVKGELYNNRALDFPNNIKTLPAITELDKFALQKGNEKGINTVFLSFASSEKDVTNLRKLINNDIQVISKIESRKGLRNLEEIVESSDGILIDRGDLSREISIGMVPYAVDTILNHCLKKGKECFIATNILDSMMTNPIPSRAEISDIWNLLSKGISGFVLAAEVAIGNNPIETVAVINHMINLFNSSKISFIDLIDPKVTKNDLPEGPLKSWF